MISAVSSTFYNLRECVNGCGCQGPRYVDRLNLTAMACPALPLCGLAIAEAERGLPDVLKTIRKIMEKVGGERGKGSGRW